MSLEYRSWKMFIRENFTAVRMAIAGICVEINREFVLHEANIPAGGRISRVGDFLARGYGPEQQALLQMIGSLIEPAPADANPGELLTGEGDPGLSLTGGSGHAYPV